MTFSVAVAQIRGYIAPNNWMIDKCFKECGRKPSWPNLKYYGGAKKTHENLSQNSVPPGWDQSPWHPAYEAAVLTTLQRNSVNCCRTQNTATHILDIHVVHIGALTLHVVRVSQQDPENGEEAQSVETRDGIDARGGAQQVPAVGAQREAGQNVVRNTCNRTRSS